MTLGQHRRIGAASHQDQQQVFANPCPAEELYRVSKDGHQLVNLVSNPEHAPQVKQARMLLAQWADQTADTIPDNPTPNRHPPPRIENGKIISSGKYKVRNPHTEMPGNDF